MGIKKIVIGARGSKLSLIQTTIVKNLVQQLLPQAIIEIATIKTSGDKNMSPIPLDTIGKGWFTKEIDRKLLTGEIDIAVHSLKDLLDTLTPGLIITAIPQREDASEALVSSGDVLFAALKNGSVIGTDSIRRKIQILKKRPDLVVKSIRGNVNRRLEKLDNGEYDALILAVAGLKRLGLEKRISEYFDPTDIIPSPGQGALAVVTRENNTELNAVLSQLNHKETVLTVSAERAFSKTLGGGCSMPVGAYAKVQKNTITLYGMLGSEDEKHMIKENISGNSKDALILATKLAENLQNQASGWFTKQTNKYVVFTREAKENNAFAKYLKPLGLSPLFCPSIAVSKNLSQASFNAFVQSISDYQWIIFTSSNGVKFFLDGFKKSGKDITSLSQCKIAVVGEKTAQTAKKVGLSVSLIPKTYTAKNLAASLPTIEKQKILLPQSTIAQKTLAEKLEKKGAIVTPMPVYKTKHIQKFSAEFDKVFDEDNIACLTFTSPSTVEGFLKNIHKSIEKKVLSLPVLSIGPVTTEAAKKHGFVHIFTADTHTIEGMITKMKQSIL